MTTILTIGAGAWGTALAALAARLGHHSLIVGRNQVQAETINAVHVNEKSLPGIPLPESLTAFAAMGDLPDGLDPDAVLLAIPAQTLRENVRHALSRLGERTPLIITAKGLERGTHEFMSQVVAEEAPHLPIAILSGPSFAVDVARGQPTAVTIAASDIRLAEQLCELFQGPTFRPYASDDMVGVQLGGALKNVLAIATGIVEGRRLGESAKAALMTRGFAEITRLAVKLGADPETLMGLSGLGDVVLTCSTAGSRNFAFGVALGEGAKVEDLLADGMPLAEGARTAPAALELAQESGVEMPVARAVAGILDGRINAEMAMEGLMARPLKRDGIT